MESKYFYLNDTCYFERGAKNAIIIDFEKERVFGIDAEVARVIDYCETGGDIAKIINNHRYRRDEIKMLLARLEDMNLGKSYRRKVFIDNISFWKSRHEYDLALKKTERIHLRMLSIQISNECLLDCSHCRNEALNSFCGCSIQNKTNGRRLEPDDIEEIIRTFSSHGLEEIVLQGGDPFLSPIVLKKALLTAHRCKLPWITIYSNIYGIIPRSIIEIIRKCDARIVVPIYSSTENIHDSITGIRGSFKQTTNNLMLLTKQKIPVLPTLHFSSGDESTKGAREKLEKKLGCPIHKSEFIYPKISNKMNSKVLITFRSIYRRKKATTIMSYSDYGINRSINRCLFGKIAITINGDILPCRAARKHKLGNYWESPPILERIRLGEMDHYWFLTKDKIDTCRRCEYRYLCDDCLFLAHQISDTRISRNVFCAYNPTKGQWSDAVGDTK
jgi:radical SAM protein with 4Fe4S-binding SPASM domain